VLKYDVILTTQEQEAFKIERHHSHTMITMTTGQSDNGLAKA
jgi:hypothetical protein